MLTTWVYKPLDADSQEPEQELARQLAGDRVLTACGEDIRTPIRTVSIPQWIPGDQNYWNSWVAPQS